MSSLEIEAKFLVPSHLAFRKRILELGGRSLSGRYLERNLRYDRPDSELADKRILLRLRQGERATLTVKQTTTSFEARHELEIEIDDFDTAQDILHTLGYRIAATYEKYREVYAIDPVLVVLDELPFGSFIEIDGPDLDTIQTFTGDLGLDWTVRIQRSYVDIFAQLCRELGLELSDATFGAFDALQPVPEHVLALALGRTDAHG